MILRLRQDLDWPLFCRSVEETVARDTIFKTIYKPGPKLAFPVQVLLEEQLVKFTAAERPFTSEQVTEQANRMRGEAFDLSAGPLLNVSFFSLAESREKIVVVTCAAIGADQWSLKGLIERSFAAYDAQTERRPMPAQDEQPVTYLQYSEWQNQVLASEEAKEARHFWQQKLAGLPDTPAVYCQKASRETRPRLQYKLFQLPTAVNEQLEKRLPADGEVNRETLFAACWYLVLWKLNGEKPFALGHLHHGRSFEPLHQTPQRDRGAGLGHPAWKSLPSKSPVCKSGAGQ